MAASEDPSPAGGASEQQPQRFTFKYVFIPCDNTEPIQELELDAPRGGDAEVTSLLDALKRHFRAASPAGKSAAQKAAQKAALLQRLQQQEQQQKQGEDGAGAAAGSTNPPTSAAGQTTTEVSPQIRDLLDRVVDGDLLGGGLVENIALLSNAPDTGFVGVNLYCDDEAALKQLPSNARASSLAMYCGKPLDVKGDAFLARVFDNDDDFRRLDFSLEEVSSGAAWVKEAAMQAEKRRDRERAGAMGSGDPEGFLAGLKKQQKQQQQGKQAKAAAAKAATPSDAERDRGNARFRQGDYEGAAGHFTSALRLAAAMPAGEGQSEAELEAERRRLRAAALANRAMAYLRMERWSDAAADATAVIEEGEGEEAGAAESAAAAAAASAPLIIKARLRRAAARREMGNAAGAKEDWEAVLRAEPANKEASEALAG